MAISGILYRLAQVGCGASLGILSLTAGVALVFYLVDEGANLSPVILLSIILSLALLSSFLVLALRLLAGRPRADGGGLFPPWGLRVAGAVYIALPIAALLAEQWRELRLGFLLVQGAIYVFFGLALFRLATKRRRLPPSPHHPQSDA